MRFAILVLALFFVQQQTANAQQPSPLPPPLQCYSSFTAPGIINQAVGQTAVNCTQYDLFCVKIDGKWNGKSVTLRNCSGYIRTNEYVPISFGSPSCINNTRCIPTVDTTRKTDLNSCCCMNDLCNSGEKVNLLKTVIIYIVTFMLMTGFFSITGLT